MPLKHDSGSRLPPGAIKTSRRLDVLPWSHRGYLSHVQAWLSIGYIVLLAILVLAFILWRRRAPVLAIAALVVGIPLWFGWEYARPTWTTGVITGTEVRRSDPDARGNTTDRYI
jgi:hypothetical protein